MVEALLISNIVLWLVVILLALLVFALTRQVGILHERVAPAGALLPTSGPKVGELTKELSLSTIDGSPLLSGGHYASKRASFILFSFVAQQQLHRQFRLYQLMLYQQHHLHKYPLYGNLVE